VDSALLVSSALVSHNVIVPMRRKITERGKIMTARAGVAVFGALAYVLALSAEGIYDLVLEASAFGSSGLIVVGIFALFSPWGGRWSAIASLLGGVLSWIFGAYVLQLPFPYVTSLAVAVVAYVAVALTESRRAGP
jgi:Na+/proline symporter